jgi:hypothetical protein
MDPRGKKPLLHYKKIGFLARDSTVSLFSFILLSCAKMMGHCSLCMAHSQEQVRVTIYFLLED